ncbi:hypothetical protein NL676_021349 [Syzygium grande]|nr:hypothetical protein NL676_021349 [Syzygium grande]
MPTATRRCKNLVELIALPLGIITQFSLKFSRCSQTHFVDIVDLLLGWALIPDFGESDRCVIVDWFVQFQKHRVGNLQFSLGLTSKFQGDMDALLQDGVWVCLHPSHVVTASCATAYVFLLRHGDNDVIEQGRDSVLVELDMLKEVSTAEQVHSHCICMQIPTAEVKGAKMDSSNAANKQMCEDLKKSHLILWAPSAGYRFVAGGAFLVPDWFSPAPPVGKQPKGGLLFQEQVVVSHKNGGQNNSLYHTGTVAAH